MWCASVPDVHLLGDRVRRVQLVELEHIEVIQLGDRLRRKKGRREWQMSVSVRGSGIWERVTGEPLSRLPSHRE